jgi:hypothetical protein
MVFLTSSAEQWNKSEVLENYHGACHLEIDLLESLAKFSIK